MASIRLNEGDRDFLRALAEDKVKCAAEEKADKLSYDKAAPIVRRIVEAKYPKNDMKVLAKYELVRNDTCIRLQLSAGGIVQFEFRNEKAAPHRPARHDCRSRIYAADASETAIISTCLADQQALKKVKERKLSDYRALIAASTTLEQVEAVWPAASALRPRKGRSLPMVLSNDIIARIKADVLGQKQAA